MMSWFGSVDEEAFPEEMQESVFQSKHTCHSGKGNASAYNLRDRVCDT